MVVRDEDLYLGVKVLQGTVLVLIPWSGGLEVQNKRSVPIDVRPGLVLLVTEGDTYVKHAPDVTCSRVGTRPHRSQVPFEVLCKLLVLSLDVSRPENSPSGAGPSERIFCVSGVFMDTVPRVVS